MSGWSLNEELEIYEFTRKFSKDVWDVSGVVHIRGKSLWNGLRDMWTSGMILASAYVLHYLSAT